MTFNDYYKRSGYPISGNCSELTHIPPVYGVRFHFQCAWRTLLTVASVSAPMYPIRGSDQNRGAVAAARRRLYAGAGLCAGSALGTVGAAMANLPVALALFGGAVPVLALQVGREYRLLGHLQRRRSERVEDSRLRKTFFN